MFDYLKQVFLHHTSIHCGTWPRSLQLPYMYAKLVVFYVSRTRSRICHLTLYNGGRSRAVPTILSCTSERVSANHRLYRHTWITVCIFISQLHFSNLVTALFPYFQTVNRAGNVSCGTAVTRHCTQVLPWRSLRDCTELTQREGRGWLGRYLLD